MNETMYMKATVSLPYISKMVGIEGKQFLMENFDSIPIKKSIADGNQKHIVILTRDRYYRKKKSIIPNISIKDFMGNILNYAKRLKIDLFYITTH